ncbi:hypothetical protein [Nonomuraea sp. CA-141351]|uniref:hypothetical protein n=1 Tax=Nonomuraea sp. CA-141351 TaxID=3239996 RepID=UPI003D943F3C
MVVFADRAGDDGFSADGAQVEEIGHVPGGLRSGVWGTLVPGLVRPVFVAVDQIVLKQPGQVAFIEDQDPVQEFAAAW